METKLESILRSALQEISAQPEFKLLPPERQNAIARELRLRDLERLVPCASDPGIRRFVLTILWEFVAEESYFHFDRAS